uniref:Secretogranin II b n=1 Tax=Scleropages formosus TaxID=113540 RepID=A0A8C9RYI6_SCLFO
MLSLPKLPTAGALFLLTTLLHACGVLGASLRGPKLRGDEPEGGSNSPYLVPSADMVKALEYIESLRQQTRGNQGPALDYDDLSRLRSLLPLAAATPKQDETGPDEAAGWPDERSQQWLKAMLRTLQRAGKEPKAAAVLPSSRYVLGNRQRPEEEEEEEQEEEEDDDNLPGDGADYEGGPWLEPGKPPKKKYPLMFEDEDSRESPYKRTNENVEEQYTPQSLATLQSVFEELGKLSAPKSHKRHSLGEEQRIYRGDSDDIYRANNMAYEDVTGGEDWTPVEEKVETEEEVKGSREEIDRGSEESDGNTAKRSSPPAKYDDKEEPDNFTKLVDYYLLKILEKSEQAEHKREELSADKRVAPASYDVNPQAIYQLIDISRKLQIPPEDLIDMLKSGEIKPQDKLLEAEEEAELPDDLERAEDKLRRVSSYGKDRNPSKFYNRRLPEMVANDLPSDLNTEDILNILGLESQGNLKAKHLLKQKQAKNTLSRYYAPSGRRGDFILSEPSVSEKRKSEDEDAVDEDELASYLAAKMLAQYPKVLKKMDLKRTSQPSSKEQQLAFETLMQDYFDQTGSDKNPPSRRMSEPDRTGDSPQGPHLDDDTLLKVLGYLNPETGENEDRDLYGKTL